MEKGHIDDAFKDSWEGSFRVQSRKVDLRHRDIYCGVSILNFE